MLVKLIAYEYLVHVCLIKVLFECNYCCRGYSNQIIAKRAWKSCKLGRTSFGYVHWKNLLYHFHGYVFLKILTSCCFGWPDGNNITCQELPEGLLDLCRSTTECFVDGYWTVVNWESVFVGDTCNSSQTLSSASTDPSSSSSSFMGLLSEMP